MNVPRWLTPWRKATDQNAVTPIRGPFQLQSTRGWIVEAFGGMWQSNLRMEGQQSLLAFSAVYACLSLIAGDISKLGVCLKKLGTDGIWKETTSPAFSPVLRRPNSYQTWKQFIEQWVLSKLIHGNTYILKERDNRNVVVALYVLDPQTVTPLVTTDGDVYYQIGENRLAGHPLGLPAVPADAIIHDRVNCLLHPLIGVAPLYACAASATQGTRIQANSSVFFQNMSRPSGQLTAPGHIPDDVAARVKKQFEDGFSGSNLGRMFVTGNGLKFEPFTIPAEQAQLIEQLKFTGEDVARAYLVPLYKIQAGSNPTFNNIAALNLEYYQQTLQPHIESIEGLLDDGLAIPSGMCVELDVENLMRMDPKTRAEVHEIGLRSGKLKPNEARAADNLPPVEGGDTPYLQQQNYSLAALARRDASEDPFKTGGGKTEPAAQNPATPDPEPAEPEDDISEDDMKAAQAIVDKALTRAGLTYA